MKKAFLFLLMVLPLIGVKANDGVFYAQGNHLIPITETDISVKKEVLTINKVGEVIKVTVYYEFFNPVKAKDLLVGFEAPPPYPYEEDYMAVFPEQPHMSNFKVVINGEALNYQIAHVSSGYYDGERDEWVIPDYYHNGKIQGWSRKQCEDSLKARDYFDMPFTYVYHFNAHFREGLNIIQHTYDFDVSGSVGEEYCFPYVLTAANRWANHQIDDFTLNINMGDLESFTIDPTFYDNLNEWSFDGVGRKNAVQPEYGELTYMFHVQKGGLTFHKNNFHPDGELNISKPYVALFFMWSDNKDAKHLMEVVGQQYANLSPLLGEELNLTAEQKRILKNLPFAYRGHVFKDKGLRQFFESTKWYVPDSNYKDDMSKMSKEEKEWIQYWSK